MILVYAFFCFVIARRVVHDFHFTRGRHCAICRSLRPPVNLGQPVKPIPLRVYGIHGCMAGSFYAIRRGLLLWHSLVDLSKLYM